MPGIFLNLYLKTPISGVPTLFPFSVTFDLAFTHIFSTNVSSHVFEKKIFVETILSIKWINRIVYVNYTQIQI